MEMGFHPMFSLTQGTSQLPYRYAENRWHAASLWCWCVKFNTSRDVKIVFS